MSDGETGIERTPATNSRKIAIIGSAPSSLPLAPFGDPSWEIWGCSPGAGMHPACTRVTRWFELHPLSQPDIVADPGYLRWMADINVPVELIRPDARIPKGVVYPYEAMVQEFGLRFFTSSVAWMLARAIMEGPHTIGMWGIDMSANEEYGHQRPGCHHFMQKAMERGIKIFVPDESDIGENQQPYGFIMQSGMYKKGKVREAELERSIAQYAQQYEAAKLNHAAATGALDNHRYFMRTFVNDPKR